MISLIKFIFMISVSFSFYLAIPSSCCYDNVIFCCTFFFFITRFRFCVGIDMLYSFTCSWMFDAVLFDALFVGPLFNWANWWGCHPEPANLQREEICWYQQGRSRTGWALAISVSIIQFIDSNSKAFSWHGSSLLGALVSISLTM